jgi:hypothetical protein
MARTGLTLVPLPGRFAVCRLGPDDPWPAFEESGGLVSLTRTADELSVVCAEEAVPAGARCERGWRCFRVRGPMALSEVGVLAALAEPLAEAGVSLFAVSTYDTDYLLVREADQPAARAAWQARGHRVEP